MKNETYHNVGTLFGENIFIHTTADVAPSVSIGTDTKVWKFTNILERAKIGKNCVIGSHVEIGRNVIIGDNCKIETGAYLPEGVTLENNVFIAPCVCMTNDKFPPSGKRWRTLVKEGASIGANSTIVCGVTIGKGAMIGAGSVVTKNIPDYAIVYGNPARIKGKTK